MDLVAFCFLIYWAFEIFVRFCYFGRTLWFKPTDVYNQMKDRYEVIVSLAGLSFFGCIVLFKRYAGEDPSPNYFNFMIPWRNLHKNLSNTPSPEYLDWSFDAAGRLCFMIPLLRLLSIFPAVSRLFFGLLAILPIFWDVYVTGLIIFYVFSALGVLLFFGKYQTLIGDANEIPDATFDSFLNSIFVCFNLFNGESWDLLMEAGVNSTGLWYMCMYFVVQMIILNMLFQDLITGIIIDASRNLSDLFQDDDHAKVDTFSFWEKLTTTRQNVVDGGVLPDDDEDIKLVNGVQDAPILSPTNTKKTLGAAIKKVFSTVSMQNDHK